MQIRKLHLRRGNSQAKIYLIDNNRFGYYYKYKNIENRVIEDRNKEHIKDEIKPTAKTYFLNDNMFQDYLTMNCNNSARQFTDIIGMYTRDENNTERLKNGILGETRLETIRTCRLNKISYDD